jgi:hypothetical protein
MQWGVWQYPWLTAHLPGRLTRMLMSVDKEGLHPFRLISILALTWLVVRLVPRGAGWLRTVWAAPLIVAGQHSLPVFCVGIFLSFLGRLMTESDAGFGNQMLVNLGGAASMFTVGAVAAWYSNKGRRPAPAPAPQSAE